MAQATNMHFDSTTVLGTSRVEEFHTTAKAYWE